MTLSSPWRRLGTVCPFLPILLVSGCSTLDESQTPDDGTQTAEDGTNEGGNDGAILATVPPECKPWCATGCIENCESQCAEMVPGSAELACASQLKAAMDCQSANPGEECSAIQTRCEVPVKAWFSCMSAACKTSDAGVCEDIH